MPSHESRRAGDAGEPLDLERFTLEAETTPARVDRLVAIGAIRPDKDGSFSVGDVIRSRLLAAFEAEGVTLDQIAIGIRDRAMTLEYVDLFYPPPSPRTGRTFEDFVETTGERARVLPQAIAAMGLPVPPSDAPMRAADEAVLRGLLEAWSVGGDEVVLRASRIYGDAVRRAAEGWVGLFDEVVSGPASSESRTVEELTDRVVIPATRVNHASRSLMEWLLDRHLERTMTELNVVALERELERRGLAPPRPSQPPAVAFVDVTGFTRLTAESGDEVGARTAVRLGELADEAARRHDGRVVKLLGDGVLLLFKDSCEAVRASIELADAMIRSGLPPAHGGVHAGAVVQRDGDVYGATVNTASRLAGRASSGSILVTAQVVEACEDFDLVFEPRGEVMLKGIAAPVASFSAGQAG
jgi:class 3 adenylate cyclase